MFLRFLILCLLFCICPLGYAANIVVSIKAETTVDRQLYTLGDIAIISHGKFANKLKQLPMGRGSRPGYFVDVPIENIKAKVYKDLPRLFSNIVWRGSEQVRVQSIGEKLNATMIENLAHEKLHQWLVERYVQFDLQLVQGLKDSVVPKGDITFAVKLPKLDKAHKRMSVWVDAYLDGEQYQTYRLWFKVAAQQMAYMAIRDIARNTSASENIVTLEMIDVTSIKGVPVTRAEQFDSARLVKPLKGGEFLTVGLLQDIPFVSKGERVKVYARAGNVGIETIAVALRDGNSEERISVVNPATQGRYTATVVAPGRVKVD